MPSVVLPGYNARHGTGYGAGDLLNAEVNVAIGTDLLRRIMEAYAKHPGRNMRADFGNPEFVKLLVAGWNSGFSEASPGGGLGSVARYLEQRGIPVTHDNVFAHARAAGATQHLSNTAKQRWQREVAALYFAQPDAGGSGVGSFLVKVAVTAAVALLAVKFVFK